MAVWHNRLLWFTGILFLLLLLAALIVSYLLDEPLRALMEKRMNENLKGYSVRLEDVDVNPFGPSIVLEGLIIIQEQHPDPPLGKFKTISAGVQWRALLAGKLVGDVELDSPEVYINLDQLREETSRQEKKVDRGWQEAVKSIYPLEINLLTVTQGRLTYVDQDPQRPLHVSRIFLNASNIRNITSPDNVYPSPFRFEATVFDDGKVKVAGQADFLDQPRPSGAAQLEFQNIALNHFAPILARYHVFMKSGRIEASGKVEYAPGKRVAHLENFKLQDLQADYIHTPSEKPAGQTVQKTRAKAEEVSNNPKFQLRIDHLQVKGDVGTVNEATDPSYRVFLVNTDLRLTNLSNHFSQGPAELELNGDFMGTGRLTVKGVFRPEDRGPDFDLDAKIEGTQLTGMNDLLRAYGNFDVTAGTFSLFSELQVKNNRIDGYVKPIFKDMNVYDRRQDADKGVFRKLYEGMVGGLSDLLSRDPQDRVAGRTELSGQVENPQADTWQLVVTIVQNAFFKAILPGFEQEVSK